MRFPVVIRHVHTELETSKMSQSPWIVRFEPILKPPQPSYLVFDSEVWADFALQLFLETLEAFSLLSRTFILSVSRCQALSSGMSYFLTRSNHPLNVPREKPILLRYCPDPLEERLAVLQRCSWFVTLQRACHWNNSQDMQGSSMLGRPPHPCLWESTALEQWEWEHPEPSPMAGLWLIILW